MKKQRGVDRDASPVRNASRSRTRTWAASDSVQDTTRPMTPPPLPPTEQAPTRVLSQLGTTAVDTQPADRVMTTPEEDLAWIRTLPEERLHWLWSITGLSPRAGEQTLPEFARSYAFLLRQDPFVPEQPLCWRSIALLAANTPLPSTLEVPVSVLVCVPWVLTQYMLAHPSDSNRHYRRWTAEHNGSVGGWVTDLNYDLAHERQHPLVFMAFQGLPQHTSVDHLFVEDRLRAAPQSPDKPETLASDWVATIDGPVCPSTLVMAQFLNRPQQRQWTVQFRLSKAKGTTSGAFGSVAVWSVLTDQEHARLVQALGVKVDGAAWSLVSEGKEWEQQCETLLLRPRLAIKTVTDSAVKVDQVATGVYNLLSAFRRLGGRGRGDCEAEKKEEHANIRLVPIWRVFLSTRTVLPWIRLVMEGYDMDLRSFAMRLAPGKGAEALARSDWIVLLLRVFDQLGHTLRRAFQDMHLVVNDLKLANVLVRIRPEPAFVLGDLDCCSIMDESSNFCFTFLDPHQMLLPQAQTERADKTVPAAYHGDLYRLANLVYSLLEGDYACGALWPPVVSRQEKKGVVPFSDASRRAVQDVLERQRTRIEATCTYVQDVLRPSLPARHGNVLELVQDVVRLALVAGAERVRRFETLLRQTARILAQPFCRKVMQRWSHALASRDEDAPWARRLFTGAALVARRQSLSDLLVFDYSS